MDVNIQPYIHAISGVDIELVMPNTQLPMAARFYYSPMMLIFEAASVQRTDFETLNAYSWIASYSALRESGQV